MRAGGLDAISQQAFGILTSSKLAGALNFKLEEHALRHQRCSDSSLRRHGTRKTIHCGRPHYPVDDRRPIRELISCFVKIKN